jgi:hypothetical protein
MRILLASLLGLVIAWAVGSMIVGQGTLSISGRVLSPDGSPLSKVNVTLCEGTNRNCRSAESGVDGRFEFNVSPGSYSIQVYEADSRRYLFYLDGGDGNLSWDDDELTLIEVGSLNTSGIEIRLPSPTEVSGVVQRSNGEPHGQELIVLCTISGVRCLQTVTELDGRFSLVVPRDDYTMLIVVSGHRNDGMYDPDAPGRFNLDTSQPGTLVVRGTPLRGLEITLPPQFDRGLHQVRGSILHDDDSTVDGYQIQVCSERCRDVSPSANGEFAASAAPGPTHIYIIHDGEIVGRYHVGSPGNFSSDLDVYTTFEVPGGDASGIDIRVPVVLTISGMVTLIDGQPAVGATIRVCPWQEDAHPCESASTGSDGRFSLTQPAGNYFIQLERTDGLVGYYASGAIGQFSEHRARRSRLNLGASTGRRQISMRLNIGERTISGRAVRWDGRPDVGLAVTACLEGRGCFWATLTDDDGRFEFGRLPSGQYRLLLAGSHRDGRYAEGASGSYTEELEQGTLIDLTSESAADLEISRFRTDNDRPQVISGTLLFADGTDAHGWSVRACWIECAIGKTLEDGRFAIQVEAGDYELQIWRDIAYSSLPVGGYQEGLTGNFSEQRRPFTTVTAPSDNARTIEIRIPNRSLLKIDLDLGTNASLAEHPFRICRPGPWHACEASWTSQPRFEWLVIPGSYDISIDFTNGVTGYYSKDAPGNFTWNGAERTLFVVSEGQPNIASIDVPARENLRIEVVEPGGELDRHPNLLVSACGVESPLACAYSQNPSLAAGREGRFTLQRPIGPHVIQIQRSGYALGGSYITRYVNDSLPGGLVSNREDAQIFSNDHVHPDPRIVTLPDIPQTTPVEIQLQPGVSQIGGPAGAVRVSELFAQSQQLLGVILLATTTEPQQVIPRGQANTLGRDAYLSAGRIAWMYVSGDEPITLRWEARTDNVSRYRHRVYQSPGWVVWQSREQGTVAHVARGLPPLTRPPGLVVVKDGAVELQTSATLDQGDVIWVESPIPFQPLLPDDIPPQFIYHGRDDPAFRTQTERTFNDIIEFFWTDFGLEADAIDVEIYADTETQEGLLARCGWGRERVRIACIDPQTMARAYTRALQYRVGRELSSPGWLAEGAVEFAAGLYLQHANGTGGDPIAAHRSPRARMLAQRSTTSLQGLEPAAGDWRPRDIDMSTTLSALAVDWLVNNAGGYDAIWHYFRHGFATRLEVLGVERQPGSWQDAFEAAFGLTINDFYERFAEYRANGFRLDGS